MAFTLRDNKYFGKPKAEMTVTSEGLRPGKAVTSLSVPLAESVALMMCVFTTTRMSVSLSPGATQAVHIVQARHRPLRRCASSAAHVRGASQAYAGRGKFPNG